MNNVVKKTKPSVILLDIETSPIIGYAWDTYDTNILKVIQPSRIMSVAWKDLSDEGVTCKSIADYRGYKKGVVDDEKLIREIWDVLDKADVVIAHHGDAFDLKKLNARFVFYGLPAPSAYKSVDTKKVASKYFKFDGNSLNALGNYLGVGKKINNGGFDLWVQCIDGVKDAWNRMKEYNIQDVVLLEEVYLKLRPFMNNHPNLAAVIDRVEGDRPSCPTCLSHSVTKRGFSITRTGRKQRFQCNDCGSWSSGPFERVKLALVNEED